MYKIFPQSLKHTYFTSALALSIVSSSLLISKSAQAISLSWTKTTDSPTQVVYSATLTNAFTVPWTSLTQSGNFTIDNIPEPLTFGPITPTTDLTSATLNMSGNFILNGDVTLTSGTFWSTAADATAVNWNIAPLGVGTVGTLPPSGAGGGAIPATTPVNLIAPYSFNATKNAPTVPVANSQVTLSYELAEIGGSGTVTFSNTPTVGFAQAGSSVSVSYNYAAPPAPPVDPRVIPFNYSKTPGLLVLGGIFGLKYALDRIKKKSHHRNLEKSSD